MGKPLDPSLPIVDIRFQFPHPECSGLKACGDYLSRAVYPKLVGQYIAQEKPFDGQRVAAWLDLRDLTYETYMSEARKTYKGNVVRDAHKADKQGFVCKPFEYRLFLPDIVAINHSKDIRSGGPVQGSYLLSVDELGGAPKTFIDFTWPNCPVHYRIFWGIFSPEPGYKQGDVVTNEKLLGYIHLRRIGNLAYFSQIMGHGDYLKFGIMYRLHFAMMEWILNKDNEYTRRLEHLNYGDYYYGSEGLQLWKKKVLFKQAYFVTYDKDIRS